MFLGLAAVFILGWSISVNQKPSVAVDSQSYRSLNTYSQAVTKEFNGLTKKTKLTFNQTAVKNSIISQFPEVEDVKINLPVYSRTARVTIEVAAPTFTLSGARGTFGENVRVVVAANGKVVGLAQEFTDVKDLPNLTDQSGYPIKKGELVLGQGTSSFILAIIAQCQKNNIPIDSFNLAKGSQEIDLRTKDKPYYVKFHLAGDPGIQIGQFLASRLQLAKTGEPTEYLDVRVDGRVFYR